MNKRFMKRGLLNNSGFAIAGIVYSILLLFIILLTSLLVMLGNRKRILDNLNTEVAGNVNGTKGLKFHFQYKNVFVANQTKTSNFTFDLLDGVFVSYNGKKLDSSFITYTSSPTFDGTKNGEYEVIYSATYEGGMVSSKRIITVVDPSVYTYDFVGASQNFVAPSDGLYGMELWGAQGDQRGGAAMSYGAYTKGEIDLKKKDTLYVYVGQGTVATSDESSFNSGAGTGDGRPGGGATDIRLTSGSWDSFDGLKSRIMVAAGSGSSYGPSSKAGAGGTLNGIEGGEGTVGTQTTVGAASNSDYSLASFGISKGGCAGGNGYYPGGGAACTNGSSGGSSFISGHTGCNAIASTSIAGSIIHTGNPNHYSGKIFKGTVMIAGNDTMPNHEGTGTMVGNSGHGYAKITALVVPNNDAYFDMDNISIVNSTAVSDFTFDPLYGVEFIGTDGKKINDGTITYTSKPSFDGSKNGTYIFTYQMTYNGNLYTADRVVKVVDANPTMFTYKGDEQSYVTHSNGFYRIELWGAEGFPNGDDTGGFPSSARGAYTKGEIDFDKGDTIYIYVGQGLISTLNATSFNGGTGSSGGQPGGGATDIRLTSGSWDSFDGLKSRIMVAAGSGSSYGAASKIGSGGTLTGKPGQGSDGGSQTSVGNSPISDYALSSFGIANGGCAGGNGYYPGGGAMCEKGSGGGSSFISGHTGCDAITSTSETHSIVHTGRASHYSGKVFRNTVMISGDESMPNHEGTGTMIGNAGHGYAKITPLILSI